MKHLYTTALAVFTALGAQAWETPGDGSVYTLSALADVCDELTANGDAYRLDGDITISAADQLTMEAGESLVIGEGCRLTILGQGNLAAEGAAYVTTDLDHPGLSILIDGDGIAEFANIEFDGVGILNTSTHGVIARDCKFTNVGSASNSLGAIGFMGASQGSAITGCTFASCQIPAIGTAANAYCGMTIEACLITDCNQDNTNKPMLNLTQPGANGQLTVRDCTIEGAQRNMVGGLSVSDLLGSPDAGEVVIEGNTITDCRYGINIMGPMVAQVRGNTLVGNHYESNALNGGSGISATAYSGRMQLVISGNEIRENMWGVTLISYGYLYDALYPGYYQGFGLVSLGQPDNGDIDSPGLNTFADNGNDGVAYDPSQPYDLYNNTDQTVYAQNNHWSGDPDTVIYDQADNSALGQVVYEPVAAGITDASKAAPLSYDAASATLLSQTPADIEVYALDGRRVAYRPASQLLSLRGLRPGIYLARTPAASIKIKVD